MTLRTCCEPGCPALIASTTSRCTTHARARDKARGTRQQRGYDAAHDRLRATYQRRMDAGETFTCWRGGPTCEGTINPHAWQLGHADQDRSRYRGPECIPCNAATAGRTSHVR